MLDNTENRRMHDLLAEVAPLLSDHVEESAPSSEDYAGEPAAQPFSRDKVHRILDRVYNRLADEAAEPVESRLREMIAESVAALPATGSPFSKGKVQRILDRVEARRVAESLPVPAETEKTSPPREALWAGLRSLAAAFFMPRPLSFEARLLSDHRGSHPLPDGPSDH